MNLSFAGCGFLGIYHVGVASCFRKYAPHLLLDKISGASAGAIAACALLCDISIGEITSDVLRLMQEARSGVLGPFSPSFNVQKALLEGLEKVLPEDAHLRVNGRLHISLTRVYDMKNIIVSEFKTRDELLQALLSSSFIPVFSGFIPPKFNGVRVMDGCYSDNLPVLDENTITVSPFCGESDICPRDPSSQLFHVNVANTSIELSKQNIYRFMRILYPPPPEVLSNMCKQGFEDALRFLHRNNLINCTRCLAVQSTYIVSDSIDESVDYDPECTECQQHRQEALVASVPDAVMKVFQEAIESANKGLINWIFKYKGMKLLSILTLPYALTAEVIYAMFVKTLSCAPLLGNNLQAITKVLLSTLSSVLQRVEKKGKQISANVVYQLALTQYGDIGIDLEGYQEVPKICGNFTVDLDSNLENPVSVLGNKMLSRRSSLVLHKSDIDHGNDTFDEIFKVASHHEAIMAYYYKDKDNKVKVTEIFDVTEAESKAIFNHEHDHKHVWDTDLNSSFESNASSLEDNTEHPGILSDPESEWGQLPSQVEGKSQSFSSPDTRPESDQSGNNGNETKPLTRKPSFAIITS